MYAAGDRDHEPASEAVETQRTAFRRAEKQYKLYASAAGAGGKSKSGRKKHCVAPTDLSAVIDFSNAPRWGKTSGGIERIDFPGFELPVFGLTDRPGFYFIPNALSIEEQCHWIHESLRTFPQPPNRTNFMASLGPVFDLFDAARKQKTLIKFEDSDENCAGENGLSNLKSNIMYVDSSDIQRSQTPGSISATTLLRKLRWSTLGLQFEWSKRNYDTGLPHNKIPDDLCRLAKKMATPAMPVGEEFVPEAAIVNYYGPNDMLSGHVDDMEADLCKPIVSISLGCKAVFLLGGKSTEEVPTAVLLRSGDIVLMAGQARECYHGIPRIFTDDNESEISGLLSQLQAIEDGFVADYIHNSRININIRQVN